MYSPIAKKNEESARKTRLTILCSNSHVLTQLTTKEGTDSIKITSLLTDLQKNNTTKSTFAMNGTLKTFQITFT